MDSHSSVKIAIFASGSGSNAREIIRHLKSSDVGTVVLVCTNNPNAGVIHVAAEADIPSLILTKKQFSDGEYLSELLEGMGVGLIVLAGYLKLVPQELIEHYPSRIINIHPALLPEFGGKGMYGMNIHQAVIDAKEQQSGITIHYVNEHYDEGEVIFQQSLDILPDWDAITLQKEILKLEHHHFPRIVENLCKEILNQ